MREINIVFKQTQLHSYSAGIQEMPEIEVLAETLQEAQQQIFRLVPLVMEECFKEKSYKVNIMLKLSVPRA
jgi:hypothetical protein